MSSSRAVAADRVVQILEGLDGHDLDFVLNFVNTQFPKGNRNLTSPGRGRGNGSGGGRGRGGRGNNSVASSKLSSATKQNGDGVGQDVQEDSKSLTVTSKTDVVEKCVLKDVLYDLGDIKFALPKVSRADSSNEPSMSRKSVQTRLNKKRSGLQKELLKFSNNPVEGGQVELLNGIQMFLLAAADASATADVRLRTSPLPHSIRQLSRTLVQLIEGWNPERISSTGFFLTEDSCDEASQEGKPKDDDNP